MAYTKRIRVTISSTGTKPIMSVVVVKEKGWTGGVCENCCLCRTPTPFWFGTGELNVALCEACASTADESTIPTKAAWMASERQIRKDADIARLAAVRAQLSAPKSPEAPAFKVDDVVRVKDPSRFLITFAKKVTDRDAIVLIVEPKRGGGVYGDRVRVRFLQRNGRGKEFFEWLRTEDLVLKSA